jgi:hypothetical protein
MVSTGQRKGRAQDNAYSGTVLSVIVSKTGVICMTNSRADRVRINLLVASYGGYDVWNWGQVAFLSLRSKHVRGRAAKRRQRKPSSSILESLYFEVVECGKVVRDGG